MKPMGGNTFLRFFVHAREQLKRNSLVLTAALPPPSAETSKTKRPSSIIKWFDFMEGNNITD